MPAVTSTVHGLGSEPDPIDRWIHIGLRFVLTAVLAAGVAGLLGPTTDTTSSTRNGTTLDVRFPDTGRPGLATSLEMLIQADDPLPRRLALTVTSDYLSTFDLNAIHPEPAEQWNDGTHVTWVFEPPAGARRLEVALDARIEPGVQSSRAAVVEVEAGPAVEFTTFVSP